MPRSRKASAKSSGVSTAVPLKTIWITQYEHGVRVYRTLAHARYRNSGLGRRVRDPVRFSVQPDQVAQWEIVLLAGASLITRGGDVEAAQGY